jgi:hypothetical protein
MVLVLLLICLSCVALSWLDDKLLCGSALGNVFLYVAEPCFVHMPITSSPPSTHPQRIIVFIIFYVMMVFSPACRYRCPMLGNAGSSFRGGGLSDNFLEQTYEHKHLKELEREPQPPPGQWGLSTRIQKVALNPVSKAAFLSLENSTVHLWSLEQPAGPLHSEKASSGVMFGAAWNPHSGTEFVVGGLRRNLKLYDVRLLGQAPSAQRSAVVWKVNDAHDDAIRDIAWSPLMPFWVASAGDDGCVQVFDIRMDNKPHKTLQCTNSLYSVNWSHSHAELLVSGGVDQKLRLWNLRLAPHYLVDTLSAPFTAPLVGTAFSQTHPMQYHAVDAQGDLVSVSMTDDFLEGLCQHRFTDTPGSLAGPKTPIKTPRSPSVSRAAAAGSGSIEKQIESYLYKRDLENAYATISEAAMSYWDQGQTERVTQLLKLAASGINYDYDGSKTFNKLLKDAAYFIPAKAVKLTEPTEIAHQEIKLLKLRIALLKLMEVDKYQDILSLEDEILNQVERSAETQVPAFDVATLRRLLTTILPHDYLRAVNFTYRLAEIFAKQNRFSDCVELGHMLLYPTIYHDTAPVNGAMVDAAAAVPPMTRLPSLDTTVGRGPNGDIRIGAGQAVPDQAAKLAHEAQVTLDRDMRNPKVVLAQLEVLYEAMELAQRGLPMAATALVEFLEPHRKILPQVLHRLFFHALLAARHYDKFFIFASQLTHLLEGYRFAEQINAMMENIGLPRLRRFLDEYCSFDRVAPWETSRVTAVPLLLPFLKIIVIIQHLYFLLIVHKKKRTT